MPRKFEQQPLNHDEAWQEAEELTKRLNKDYPEQKGNFSNE